MIFTVLTLSQMGQAMSVRSDRESLFTLGLCPNKPLLGAVLVTLLLQLVVVYWGPLQRVFGSLPLSAFELAIALGFATVVFWTVEMEKLIRRRRSSRRGKEGWRLRLSRATRDSPGGAETTGKC